MKRRCPSAKMTSKAREDLPEPEGPVTTTNLLAGIVTLRFFRLFSRAPIILKSSLFKAIRLVPPLLCSGLPRGEAFMTLAVAVDRLMSDAGVPSAMIRPPFFPAPGPSSKPW